MTSTRQPPKTDQVLDFLRTYHAEHHFMPTMKEIGDAIGSSTSVVTYVLLKLENDGSIRREAGKSRAIVLPEQTA